MVIRVVDWIKHFENNRTKELKHLDWVPIPNRMDGDGYTQLVDHENGGAHLGAWLAIVEIASRTGDHHTQRGVLLRSDGTPHTPQSLARISRLPASLFEEAIARLLEIRWIERIPLESLQVIAPDAALAAQNGKGHSKPKTDAHQDSLPQDAATIPQDAATIPQDAAPLRARASAHSQKERKKGTEGNGRERKEGKERTNGHFADSLFSPEYCEAFLGEVGWRKNDIDDQQVKKILALDPTKLPDDTDSPDSLAGIYLRLDQFQNHFWPKYWRKVALKHARETWMKATEDATVIGDILRAEELQAPSMLKREPEARPHAGTWLNGKRWNDEIEAE